MVHLSRHEDLSQARGMEGQNMHSEWAKPRDSLNVGLKEKGWIGL